MKRCEWAEKSELEQEYHDNEWGVETHDERELFEFLVLESMQAGLSWSTILQKRITMARAFDEFDYEKIAQYDSTKIEALLSDSGIIRNKLKVNAAINNAKVFMEIQKEYGSFDKYIWSFVDFKQIDNKWQTLAEVPASTELSDQISKALKKKGFKFVGTTIIYSYMQAIGMINDHVAYCFKETGKSQ